MGVALVSGIHTPAVASEIGPMCWAGFCPDMRRPEGVRPAGPYGCGVVSPAYTFYYDAKADSCPAGMKATSFPREAPRNY
jgi:hypothetical protein